MSFTRPGPESVDFSYSHAGSLGTNDLYSRRDVLIERHSEHKDRVRVATQVANGEWYNVWPELSNHPEAPTVANIVEMGINHWSAIGGSVLPSVRVPVDISSKRTQARRGARKRERRLRELIHNSELSDLMAQFWGDYAGAGTVVMGGWCNFEAEAKDRNPYITRYDPRHTYTVTDPQGRVTELLVARMMPRVELQNLYPNLAVEVFGRAQDSIEEWIWYMPNRFLHVLADTSDEGRKNGNAVVISDVENPLGFVPVVEIVRPTFDGQRRGVFDQTIHILKTMHRLMTLSIHATEEAVFPPLVEHGVINPDEIGPGAVISLRDADGRLERLNPTSQFDVKDTVAMLSDAARTQGAFPQQLTGEPGASIVSARGIAASMGQIDARLALAHKQFEVAMGKVFGFLLALDETFCDTPRTVLGDHRDAGQEGETWLPSRDINGAWLAEATYGIGAGSDPANVEMRLSMHLANGVISHETYRQQLPFLENPDHEQVLILREQMSQALLTGILQRASEGDLEPAAEALKLMGSDDVDFDSIVADLVKFLMAPEPEALEQGAGDAALEAAQGAESLARGGIPGGDNMAPDPASVGLPPLGQLMGQDSRYIA